MNVIDGQAGLISYFSLIFYSLTIDNILNIVILIILSTVTINALIGENGLITNAQTATMMTEFSIYKEEMETFSATKKLENTDYSRESLNAGKANLVYDTKVEEGGNIQTVIPSMDGQYLDKFEIIKGELLLTTTDGLEMQVAMRLGIEVNPYEIVDGVLLSSNTNLGLQTTNGVLTIPESVREIGAGAFSGVTGLKEVVIPGTVKVIQRDAFSYNTEIEKVTMQYGVESIGDAAFKGCTGLTEIIMPDSVTEVGNEAFRNCTNLTTVQLSNSLTSLRTWMFGECRNLITINIPSNLTEIGDYTFSSCIKLDNIIIPAGVENISTGAFSSCTSLYNITIDETNATYEIEDGIIYRKDGTSLIMLVTMAEEEIVTIKEGITQLGAGTLSICTNMKTLNLPSTINFISDNTFAGLNLLETINFPSGNNSYMVEDGYLYSKDGKTLIYVVPTKTNIDIKDTVETIRGYAINGRNVTDLIIPDTVKNLSGYMFSNTTNLKKIEIGSGVTNLSSSFKSYSGIPDGLEIIIDSANPSYKVEGNLILTKDGKKLITYVNATQSVVVPEGVEILSSLAFESLRIAQEIILSSTLKEIESSAFIYCSSLTEIQIPNSIERIGENAFLNCSNLQSIKIDKEAGSIEGAPWGATKGDRVVQWLR